MGLKAYRQAIFDMLGYKPTEAQSPVYEDNHRVRLVAGGWRAGKSHVGAKEVVLRVPISKLIWLIGKNYSTCREEFRYVFQDLLKLSLVLPKEIHFPEQGPCSLTAINGCRVETKSAEESEKIGMQAPDFILVCEAAQIDHDAYLRIRGRVAEKGGSIILTGTFEGSLGWYVDYYKRGQASDPEIKSFSLPSWSNTVMFPGGRQDPEILSMEQEIGPLFTEYCAAIPCAPSGLVLPEFSNSLHVGDYPFDPRYPVDITVDPGYGGAYAVEVIQIRESVPYVVDEIYEQFCTTEDIIAKVKSRPWGANIAGGTIDVAGKQHQAMPAPVEMWQAKLGIYLESQWVDVEGGIDTLRTFLAPTRSAGHPGIYFHNRCLGIISEMGGCKSPLPISGMWLRDTGTGKLIDRFNHAAKAVIYYIINRYGYATNRINSDYGKVFSFGKGKNERDKVLDLWMRKPT